MLNGVHKILAKHNLEQACPTKKFQTKKVHCWLAELELPTVDRMELNLLIPQWELLDEQLEIVEAKIAQRAADDERVKLLESVPGMGHYTRRGDRLPDRRHRSLPATQQPGELFRLDPRLPQLGRGHAAIGFDHQAGQQDGAAPVEPSGDQSPAFDGAMRNWFKRIKRRRGSKIARVAVMRRLATILWHMLKKKQKYHYDSPIKKHKEFEAFEGKTDVA